MTASFFEELAAQQMPAPVRRKLDVAAKRAARAKQAEQELKDEQTLSKLYRQYRREKTDRLLSGERGKDVAGIVSFLRTMTLSSAPALIELVRRSGWIGSLDIDDRFVLLRLINDGIVKLRLGAGLPEADDALSFAGEPDKAFHQIKTIMGLDGL